MAANIENNLYPPIINTYMPTFAVTQPLLDGPVTRIYFALSKYNSVNEIKHVQLTLVDPATNMSMITSLHPTGIKVAQLNEDTSLTRDDRFYINLYKDDFDACQINHFYKVQLRFSKVEYKEFVDGASEALTTEWLVTNQHNFSEWSTVCLIKGIQQPTLKIKGFSDIITEETVFTNNTISFVGQLNTYTEQEFLKQYEIKLYEKGSNKLLQSSGVVYTNSANPNEINYTFKYSFENDKSYVAKVSYMTNSLYTQTIPYEFRIVLAQLNKINANIFAYIDNDEGRIKVQLKANNSDPFIGNVAIRRSSEESNFTIWEDMKIVSFSTGGTLDYTWYDATVQSGVWYKYDAHRIDSNRNRGLSVEISEPVMIILDDMFLSTAAQQLKIKFDPQVSSFKHNILETKTDTLGSQFPFIRRNGSMNYRQFSISGLISHLIDENELFTTEEEIYKNSNKLFSEYNLSNRITPYRDYVKEKRFRDKVTTFLQDGKVKLFRSPTEGNMLVRLMDISFTPNQQLGRLVSSFSATAYEVDIDNLENYQKYNIHTIGEYEKVESAIQQQLGQIIQSFNNGTSLLKVLNNKHSAQANVGYKIEVKNIPWAKITINTEPYLIKDTSTGLQYVSLENETVTGNVYYGYIVELNGDEDNKLLMTSNTFEFENLTDFKIITPKSLEIEVDYVCQLVETEDVAEMPYILYYRPKVGQLWNSFNPKDYLYKQIYNKYLEKYEINGKAIYQYVTTLREISIEAQQAGTVVYIKERQDTDFNRHIIGETQTLRIEGDIEDFYFAGIHLNESKDPYRNAVRDNEYIDTRETYDDELNISRPLRNHVYYIIGKGNMIYFNNNWYTFTAEGDILIPVDAIINYYCDAIRGERSS